ncbi:PAS domain S-box protein [Deinococcus maricopensis]|uniref:histidine kinase n=1 Tax=Deinococcus maricopensis (strain DSM 21211 / LMG 22137 / NRRL B-23946 / LB-34) TaxID=709986 RepID=E8U368_DEIML|nr:PAS domain S-box protein [Deinococcus maricopensis]ADV66013.1 PAS/PAC sensor signal transduction histidine kinase [Deinococcus maricopensis DSM 21211]
MILSDAEHLRALLQLVDGVVWEADPATRQNTFVSDKVETLLGYTAAQWQTPNFWDDHVHPDDRERVLRDTELGVARGEPFQQEYRMFTGDGRVVWMRDRVTPIVQDGRLVKLGGVMIDVTRQKAAEQRMRALQSRFEQVFAAAPVGITLTGLHDGHVIDTNDAFLDVIGYDRATVIGSDNRTLNVWVSPADRAHIARTVEANGRVHQFESQLHHRSGAVRDVLLSCELLDLQDAGGQPILLILTQDISERKRVEAALEASEARFRALVQNSTDIITVLDRQGAIQYASPSMTSILGYELPDILGEICLRYMHPDEHPEILEAFRVVVRGGTGAAVRLVSRFSTRDGEGWRALEWVATNRLDDPNIHGIVMNSRDVTEAQAAQAALQESQARLLASEKLASLGRLTAGLAHEINTPLAATMNYLHEAARLAQEYLDSIGAPGVNDDDHREIARELRQALGEAEQTAGRIGEFIRRMRGHTRDVNSGAVDFDPGRLASETLAMLAHQARAANIALILDVTRTPLVVRGEPGRFTQVVTNLVVNAIHACEGGRGSRVTVTLDRVQGRTELRVTDDGSGIPASVLPRIFEPMFTTKDVGKGTGLGLSIIRDIITGHFHGEIDVDTRVDAGTTFIVQFP